MPLIDTLPAQYLCTYLPSTSLEEDTAETDSVKPPLYSPHFQTMSHPRDKGIEIQTEHAEYSTHGWTHSCHSDQEVSSDLLTFCYLFLITRTANLPEQGATSLPANLRVLSAYNACATQMLKQGNICVKGFAVPSYEPHSQLLTPCSASPSFLSLPAVWSCRSAPAHAQPSTSPELPQALYSDSQPFPLGINFRCRGHTSSTKIAWVKTEQKLIPLSSPFDLIY